MEPGMIDSGIDQYNVVRGRYRNQRLNLADAEFAFFPLRLKMSRYMTDQHQVADRQHQCQD